MNYLSKCLNPTPILRLFFTSVIALRLILFLVFSSLFDLSIKNVKILLRLLAFKQTSLWILTAIVRGSILQEM